MKSLAYDPAHVMSCDLSCALQYRPAYPRTWQHCTIEQTARNCDVTYKRECREDDVNPQDVCINTKQLEVVQNKRRCRSA